MNQSKVQRNLYPGKSGEERRLPRYDNRLDYHPPTSKLYGVLAGVALLGTVGLGARFVHQMPAPAAHDNRAPIHRETPVSTFTQDLICTYETYVVRPGKSPQDAAVRHAVQGEDLQDVMNRTKVGDGKIDVYDPEQPDCYPGQ